MTRRILPTIYESANDSVDIQTETFLIEDESEQEVSYKDISNVLVPNVSHPKMTVFSDLHEISNLSELLSRPIHQALKQNRHYSDISVQVNTDYLIELLLPKLVFASLIQMKPGSNGYVSEPSG